MDAQAALDFVEKRAEAAELKRWIKIAACKHGRLSLPAAACLSFLQWSWEPLFQNPMLASAPCVFMQIAHPPRRWILPASPTSRQRCSTRFPAPMVGQGCGAAPPTLGEGIRVGLCLNNACRPWDCVGCIQTPHFCRFMPSKPPADKRWDSSTVAAASAAACLAVQGLCTALGGLQAAAVGTCKRDLLGLLCKMKEVAGQRALQGRNLLPAVDHVASGLSSLL